MFKKSVLICFLTFSVSVFAQAVGGGGNGGGGLSNRMSTGCAEGRRYISTEQVGERSQMKLRICRGGTYMTDEEKAAYIRNPKKEKCKEGLRSVWAETHTSGRTVNVFKVCQDGRWVEQ